ncbi:hypothetical protein E8E13_003695 [Curvularia kusanoi]|uniref:Epoxide hydrolase N-terminal domain-containing protein n=1 Tax=Curvularia kusanoi TaxID=90978 RepID=A0A9P4WE68_CURKU|nr:hypothetical protein E8E13_003695 [Curvularia kusanoi]
MTTRMQTIQEDIDAIVPYSMHVSSRYLDLTKQKLELTRLPKENLLLSPRAQWGLGVPKSVLEPLLDHWLESYDWRAQEDMFNASLPQFRTLISRPSPPQNGTKTTSVESTAIREKRKGEDALSARLMGPILHQLLSVRPQTLAFSLCDSPVGLLAVLLDLLGVQGTGPSLGARPRSPFLDPEELEQQDREYEAAGHERVRSDDTVKASQNAVGPEGTQVNPQPWSPTDILNWTMM